MSEPVDELREDAALMRAMVECRVESVGLDQWARAWKRAEQMITAEADRLSRLLPTGAAGERTYSTLSELWNELANELDESRTPDEIARLKAAMAALKQAPAREPVAWGVARDSDGRISFDVDGCTRLLRTEELADEEAGRYMAHYGSGHSAVALYTHPPTPEAGTVTEEVSAFLSTVGCGDHSCLFVKPQGMGTNGSCRCSRKPGFPERVARLVNALAGRRGA